MKKQSLAFVAGLLLLTLGCQPIRATTVTLSQADDAPSTTSTPAALSAVAPLTTMAALTTANAVPLADGRTLYRQYYCGICHQSTDVGTTGAFGPSHDGLAANAVQHLQAPTYQGDATTVQEYLYESLVDPQRFVVPGYELTPHRMPSYRFLTPAELETLMQWLQQQ